jgi:AmmeMemoRadiSam system protein B
LIFFILFQVLLLREPVDKVGFSTNQKQIDAFFLNSKSFGNYIKFKKNDKVPLGVISPHDDHLYAAPLYIEALKDIKAKNIIIFGVAHKAKKWGVEGLLIFEDFDGFKTPKGFLEINKGLREYILKNLKKDEFLVCRDCQAEEHSVEGILPFLEHFNPDVKILPILVPYISFDKMEEISKDLSLIIFKWLKENNLKPVEDLQIVISSDAVHYGDQGWGGKNYAPYGTDCRGLKKAIKRDIKISKKYLSGVIKKEKLREFLLNLVEEKDLKIYKIPWCGRFSVTFSALFLKDLAKNFGREIKGVPIAYGTSVQIGETLEEKNGLGTTAEATLHHWVGYLSLKFIF